MATVVPTLQQHPTPGAPTCEPVSPDLSQPLINEPKQNCPTVQLDAVGALQYLVGTWTNQNLANGQGGPDSPYSYNLMVLPEQGSPEGFILKNMQYYEEITFSPIHGNAANRGGTGVQVGNPLFYEQRIYISAASGAYIEGQVGAMVSNTLVHAENGAWLVMTSSDQFVGPYGAAPNTVPHSTPPTGYPTLVKQIAVPHGNSVLALGDAPADQPQSGSPSIPDLTGTVVPSGINPAPYNMQDAGNPSPAFALNPNKPIMEALNVAPVTNYIMFQVDSNNSSGGAVTNIGFEQQHADVVQYSATYWLEQLEGSDNYNQLQYTQTIVLKIPINGQDVLFPHVTSNTLTYVQGSGSRPSPTAQTQSESESQA